jgi:hypothetical protein
MGMFERVFGRVRKSAQSADYFKTLTAYQPVFRSWNGRMYENELVRSAIDARSRHISKLHVHIEGSAHPALQSRMKNAPNDFQTWSQFLYRTNTILDMQNSVFFVPMTDEYGRKIGVYSLMPSMCEVVSAQGEPWLRYTFSSGEKAAIPLKEARVMTKFQYRDEFFGERNNALDNTMELINIQNQGIGEAVKNSNTFRFMAKVNNFTKPEDLAKERKRFSRENLQGDSAGGLLLFPNTYTEIKQITSTPYVIDAAQQEQINTNVFNYYGVNTKIIQNIASGDEWASFYEGAVEVFAVQLSEVLTAMFFTEKEQTRGNRIYATANRLQYMSNQDKLNVSRDMADRGLMMIDEIREIWNLPPLPDGLGRFFTLRGEYYLLGEDGTVKKKGETKKEDNIRADENGA